MTLQSRLNLGILAIAIVLVAPLVLSLRALQRFQADTTSLRDREYAATLLLGRMRAVHDDLLQGTTYISVFPTDTARAQYLDQLQNLSRQTDTLARLTDLASVGQLRTAISRIGDQAPRAFAFARASRYTARDSVVDLLISPALLTIDRVLENIGQAMEQRTAERVDGFAARTEEAAVLAIGALGIAILLAFGIAIWLTRSISAPLRELDAGMRAVAEGHFRRPLAISGDRGDEFGRLAESFRSMAAQLEELDRLKAEFVSVATHELKTPVNVMLGYLQLLQENVYGELTDRQREIAATLVSQTQQLSRLIRQLLDVSRFDAGGGKLDTRPVVLSEFLDDLERAFRVLALQREIQFDVKSDRDIPHEVIWDPVRINEVLGNLLSNAFKFTNKGGRVSLTVGREGDQVRMQVSDTGAGIPREQLPHIFEKFYQADTQAPLALRGAGLGLAIAKSIVTAHNGSIEVESRVGAGTTFTLRLPIRVIRRPSAGTPVQGIAG
ncbi:MAG: HAMP domain-containing histidine kinase [Gemmatimonadaceae bacterium]|nr:HAMP domain-containing histidine kinase [Gemmatimonadaceae bacterium]